VQGKAHNAPEGATGAITPPGQLAGEAQEPQPGQGQLPVWRPKHLLDAEMVGEVAAEGAPCFQGSFPAIPMPFLCSRAVNSGYKGLAVVFAVHDEPGYGRSVRGMARLAWCLPADAGPCRTACWRRRRGTAGSLRAAPEL
jgi:hypothetical protein